jgi:hypothetical protein
MFVIAIVLAAAAVAPTWRALDAGVEYALVEDTFHIVRIDPTKAVLRLVTSSKEGTKPRTAGQWADDVDLVVAINAGMFQDDHSKNVGYARDGTHENNARWNEYQSVLAWGSGFPLVLADKGTIDATKYTSVVQNLRLIKGNGENVWSKNNKKWSEALAAIDDKGRLLFVFTRAPFPMRELNERLLSMGLGIQRAMHLEGGPEASLSIRAEGLRVDLAGSYETGFNEHDDNKAQWPIPNVLGVARR